MKKYLIVGASSGIGRALTKKLVDDGNVVWGVARREELLKSLKAEVIHPRNFLCSAVDISKKNAWFSLIRSMKQKKFCPEVVVLGAAILKNDLAEQIDLNVMHELFNINYFSFMEGINYLIPLLKRKSQIITISSSSSFKGSGVEGIGYAASKAALSISFESLQQKFGKKVKFKTVFLGPVKTGMNPFMKHSLFTLTEEQAVKTLIEAMENDRLFYYNPLIVFFVIRLTKLVSQRLYFKMLNVIDSQHLKNERK